MVRNWFKRYKQNYEVIFYFIWRPLVFYTLFSAQLKHLCIFLDRCSTWSRKIKYIIIFLSHNMFVQFVYIWMYPLLTLDLSSAYFMLFLIFLRRVILFFFPIKNLPITPMRFRFIFQSFYIYKKIKTKQSNV